MGGSGWPVTSARVFSGGHRRSDPPSLDCPSFFPWAAFRWLISGVGVTKTLIGGVVGGVGAWWIRVPMLVEDVFREKRGRKAGKKRRKSFRRGGKGRDSCSPEI